MLDYRPAFDVEVKNSNEGIQVLIFSRKDVPLHTMAARVQELTMSLDLLQVMHMHLY